MSIRRCILRWKHFSLPHIECCNLVQVKEALKKCHAKAKEMAKEETNREICKLLHNVDKWPDAVTCLKWKKLSLKLRGKINSFFLYYPKVLLFCRPTLSIEMADLATQYLLGLVSSLRGVQRRVPGIGFEDTEYFYACPYTLPRCGEG